MGERRNFAVWVAFLQDLGCSYALQREMRRRRRRQRVDSWREWLEGAAALRPLTLVAATDGNHGRAVAHLARLLGLSARVFVPAALPAGYV